MVKQISNSLCAALASSHYLSLTSSLSMATLTRPRSSSSRQHNSSLESHIPSPFPKEILEEERVQDNLLDDLAHEELDVDPFLDHSELIDGATAANTPSIEVEYSHSVTLSQETEDVRTVRLVQNLY